MARRIVLAAVAGALALAIAPAFPPDTGLGGTTAQAADMKVPKAGKSKRAKRSAARPAAAEDGGAKQMRMQANPPGSRFPYSYRY